MATGSRKSTCIVLITGLADHLERPARIVCYPKSRCPKAAHLHSRDIFEDLLATDEILQKRHRPHLVGQQVSVTM